MSACCLISIFFRCCVVGLLCTTFASAAPVNSSQDIQETADLFTRQNQVIGSLEEVTKESFENEIEDPNSGTTHTEDETLLSNEENANDLNETEETEHSQMVDDTEQNKSRNTFDEEEDHTTDTVDVSRHDATDVTDSSVEYSGENVETANYVSGSQEKENNNAGNEDHGEQEQAVGKSSIEQERKGEKEKNEVMEVKMNMEGNQELNSSIEDDDSHGENDSKSIEKKENGDSNPELDDVTEDPSHLKNNDNGSGKIDTEVISDNNNEDNADLPAHLELGNVPEVEGSGSHEKINANSRESDENTEQQGGEKIEEYYDKDGSMSEEKGNSVDVEVVGSEENDKLGHHNYLESESRPTSNDEEEDELEAFPEHANDKTDTIEEDEDNDDLDNKEIAEENDNEGEDALETIVSSSPSNEVNASQDDGKEEFVIKELHGIDDTSQESESENNGEVGTISKTDTNEQNDGDGQDRINERGDDDDVSGESEDRKDTSPILHGGEENVSHAMTDHDKKDGDESDDDDDVDASGVISLTDNGKDNISPKDEEETDAIDDLREDEHEDENDSKMGSVHDISHIEHTSSQEEENDAIDDLRDDQHEDENDSILGSVHDISHTENTSSQEEENDAIDDLRDDQHEDENDSILGSVHDISHIENTSSQDSEKENDKQDDEYGQPLENDEGNGSAIDNTYPVSHDENSESEESEKGNDSQEVEDDFSHHKENENHNGMDSLHQISEEENNISKENEKRNDTENEEQDNDDVMTYKNEDENDGAVGNYYNPHDGENESENNEERDAVSKHDDEDVSHGNEDKNDSIVDNVPSFHHEEEEEEEEENGNYDYDDDDNDNHDNLSYVDKEKYDPVIEHHDTLHKNEDENDRADDIMPISHENATKENEESDGLNVFPSYHSSEDDSPAKETNKPNVDESNVSDEYEDENEEEKTDVKEEPTGLLTHHEHDTENRASIENHSVETHDTIEHENYNKNETLARRFYEEEADKSTGSSRRQEIYESNEKHSVDNLQAFLATVIAHSPNENDQRAHSTIQTDNHKVTLAPMDSADIKKEQNLGSKFWVQNGEGEKETDQDFIPVSAIYETKENLDEGSGSGTSSTSVPVAEVPFENQHVNVLDTAIQTGDKLREIENGNNEEKKHQNESQSKNSNLMMIENSENPARPNLKKSLSAQSNPSDSVNEVGFGHKSEDAGHKSEDATTDPQQSSMGSYVVLGVIMAIIVVLLGYSVLRSRRQNQTAKPQEDFGTEMKDLEKTLLPAAGNGNVHISPHPEGDDDDDDESKTKLLSLMEADDGHKPVEILVNGDKTKNDDDLDSIESQIEESSNRTTNPFKFVSQKENDLQFEHITEIGKNKSPTQIARERFFNMNSFQQSSPNADGEISEIVVEKTPSQNGLANGNSEGSALVNGQMMEDMPSSTVTVVEKIDEDSVLKMPVFVNSDKSSIPC